MKQRAALGGRGTAGLSSPGCCLMDEPFRRADAAITRHRWRPTRTICLIIWERAQDGAVRAPLSVRSDEAVFFCSVG